ncbi:MAG TPA: DUF1343 domain-containing protein, partial [Streptomyces sp.]|nr:DUF1343 domain-containing protein [Streptomyces sp.]
MTLSRRGVLAVGGAVGALAATAAGSGTAAASGPGGGPGAGRSGVRTGFARPAADGDPLLAGQKGGGGTNPTGGT